MIKQLKMSVVTAAALSAMVAIASPAFAADSAGAPKKAVSCTQEAKDSGLTDPKEIKAYAKKCKHKRAEAKKHKKVKKHKKIAKKKHEQVHQAAPAAPAPEQVPAPQQGQ